VAVQDVVDEGDSVAHVLAAPVEPGPVDCAIDWDRRFDHMQQHTGQHLLSAVFEELLGLHTVSFHLGAESSTIDLEGGTLDAPAAARAERRANQLVSENRPVTVVYEDAAQAEGLRKPSGREGTLRIVSIDGFDRSACGGTHVRTTGEIGVILIRKLEKIRQTVRAEFLCGARAVARARADYEALNKIAQLVSASFDSPSTRAGNSITTPPPAPMACAASRAASTAAASKSSAPWRRVSPRNRKPFFWLRSPIRHRSCWPRPPIPASMPVKR
jgi:alanyl-tRNA synthetase